jgi:hypothetical protein
MDFLRILAIFFLAALALVTFPIPPVSGGLLLLALLILFGGSK